MFLGTPHRGADLAVLLKAVLSVTFASQDFVNQLCPNSELVSEINDAFRDRAQQLDLSSYYESTGIRGVGVLPMNCNTHYRSWYQRRLRHWGFQGKKQVR
jgi:hypothetical protein